MLIDAIAVTAVTIVGLVTLVATTRRRMAGDANMLIVGFFAHVGASIAQVLITRYVYGGGDLLGYYYHGTLLVDLIASDFGTFFPRVVELFLGGAPTLPVDIHGEGSSTGSMSAAAALSLMVTGGSLYASCVLFGTMAYSGQVALFMMFRELFPISYRPRIALACLFIPSVVFWSGGMLKEAIALCGLGWLSFWSYRVFICGRYGLPILFAAASAGLLGLFKSYVFFPFAIGMLAWVYWWKAGGIRVNLQRPIYFAAAISLAVLVVIGLGRLFPSYAAPNIANETARMQELYYRQDSGSGIQYSDRSDATAGRQIILAPFGLATALFRPFIFEAHNATAGINALETLFLTIVLLMGLYRRGLSQSFELVRSSPVLVFLLVFVVIFGTGVGLAAPNLGSLSRYRILMMPFYGVLLAAILPLRR